MIKQKILPSVHLLELFMPCRKDEKIMLNVLRKAVDIGFYKGIEISLFFDRYNIMYVREILEMNQLDGTTFLVPYLKEKNLSLSSLDSDCRTKSIEFAIEMAKYAAAAGFTNFCVPSGDDPGDTRRKEAKKLFADSLMQLGNACKKLGLNVTLEPLDRYAFKKQLIGPMKESMIWFAPIHEACPNIYIHWDSAHEALGQTDLMLSLDLARPYIAQFHLCNAILNPNHPCYGDLHMDIGEPPLFKTEGFLTPEIGAKILQKVSSFEKVEGVKNTYVSMEVLGHPGDDFWLKEKNSRLFLKTCMEMAEIKVD